MLLFAGKVTEDVLLAVPHRFWTFSIPKAIRGILLRDRNLLSNKRISPGLVASMTTLRHSGFSVHSTRSPADPKILPFFTCCATWQGLRWLSQKCPSILKKEKVIYRANVNAMLGTDRIQVEPFEFVAKVLMHVPEKNKRRVIGYGVYSSRALGERKKQARCEELAAGIGATVSSYEPLTEADEVTKRRRQSSQTGGRGTPRDRPRRLKFLSFEELTPDRYA